LEGHGTNTIFISGNHGLESEDSITLISIIFNINHSSSFILQCLQSLQMFHLPFPSSGRNLNIWIRWFCKPKQLREREIEFCKFPKPNITRQSSSKIKSSNILCFLQQSFLFHQ
jgi:hypothetical protein